MEEARISRWRMVLGPSVDPQQETALDSVQQEVDGLLESIYGKKGGTGFGRSTVKIRKWLEGIRSHFPQDVVRLLQKDALEMQGIREMLLEPELLEKLEPSISNVAMILQLHDLLPERSKQSARMLVEQLLRELEKKLKGRFTDSLQRLMSHHSRPMKPNSKWIDWRKTIHRNLKHYQPSLQTIVPDQWYGFRKGKQLPEVFILMDKSESMLESMIYAAVIGSVLAGIRTVKTNLIYFDTEVTDVSGLYDDPTDLLLKVPCGGGTDIQMAVHYASQKIRNDKECVLFLISDLFEGGSRKKLLWQLEQLLARGVRVICLLCIGEQGKPDYDHQLAKQLAQLGIACFACPPDQFADLLSDALLYPQAH